MDASTQSRWQFLYRQKEGTIGPREWILASLPPTAILIVMTLIWIVIRPREERDPSQGLIDFGVAATYLYLLIYAFVVLICAVAQYFVSAKRLTDLARPQALAGALPFAIFVAGAANWYEPRSEGTAPHWLTLLIDAIAVAAVVWTVAELGFAKGRRAS